MPEGAAAVYNVKLVSPPDGSSAVPLPHDCQQIVDAGGIVGYSFFVRYHVDDGLLLEGRFCSDGRRCSRAMQSIGSDYFRLLDSRDQNKPPLLAPKRVTNFETRLEMLGWIIDTKNLTVSMTPSKLEKLHRLRGDWPVWHQTATARQQLSGLTVFLVHVSFTIRPGKFFVGRLLSGVDIPQLAAFPSGLVNPYRRVTLGVMFHFWRWFGDKGFAYRGAHFSTRMYNVIIRPKQNCRCSRTLPSRPSEGIAFRQATYVVANCQPKRSIVFAVRANTFLVLTTSVSVFSSCWVRN